MFIIPTGLLKEKSMMVPPDNIKTVEILSEVDVETIEKILSLEKKFTDFIFEPSTWFDGFIVELLRWFDNKINEIYLNDFCDINVRFNRYKCKNSYNKKVSDIFIDSKISDRKSFPIVLDSLGNVLWLPGVKKSKFCKTKEEKYDIILKYY